MIVFPNCKINLGLHVRARRTDGYHNIETVFYPVPLKDVLEIISSNSSSPTSSSSFQFTGIPVAGDSNSNLCVKAYQLLKTAHPHLPAIQLHLHKTIPIGAGLGGGSADGAFTLLALNKKFNLQLSESELIEHALKLGSDCPFFIVNSPSIATGRGEVLQPITLELQGYHLVIINPGIHINTGWAFSQLAVPVKETDVPGPFHGSLDSINTLPVKEWKQVLKNDFEPAVFAKYPVIASIKRTLYNNGALYAAMSGTGSSVYGLFNISIDPSVLFPENYLVKTIQL